MKRLISALVLVLLVLSVQNARAQIYGKLNLLYATVGVINPQVEFRVSPHSSVELDLTYSPWQSINNNHLHFGLFQTEYRYYFKSANNGWYLSGNLGMIGFDMNKPKLFSGGLISFKEGYSKGFGIMLGIGFGYEYQFRERWLLDVYFAFDFMQSWYNGYNSDGTIIMVPYGHEHYVHPDPFNGSSEWIPTKFGLSIGYRLFNPKKQ